jgi:hypothetical protein
VGIPGAYNSSIGIGGVDAGGVDTGSGGDGDELGGGGSGGVGHSGGGGLCLCLRQLGGGTVARRSREGAGGGRRSCGGGCVDVIGCGVEARIITGWGSLRCSSGINSIRLHHRLRPLALRSISLAQALDFRSVSLGRDHCSGLAIRVDI